jgi:LCP family protein required for cell wall assembly
MPQRMTPQPILAGTDVTGGAAVPRATEFPLSGGERPRQRRPEAPVEPGTRKAKAPRKKRKLFKRTGLIIGAIILALGLFLGFKFYKDIARLTGNANPFSLFGAFTPAHLKNQDGRVNILVAGNSADDAGHDGATLTDSIMVLSVNTRNNTALMLSIPRDLWVDIPGNGHAKINEAYADGGMDLLQEVVEENLGLTIDYHTLVNYAAFHDLVDAVGGITITIKSPDPRGLYDPSIDWKTHGPLVKLSNGTHTLNGQQALDLARARGDAYGSYGFTQADFDRTDHQREMLLAIKDKASSASVIANPFKVSALVDAVGKNVKTNLQLNEIQTLYTYMKKVDDTKIASYNLNTLKGKGTTMLANYTTPLGQSALVPAAGVDDFSDIQAQITRLLSNDPMVREAAEVVILNATDTSGLAAGQEDKLSAAGMNVLLESNAPTPQTKTTVIDNSGGKKPGSLAYLKKHYSATVTTDAALSAKYPDADLILVLGQNVAAAQATSGTATQPAP